MTRENFDADSTMKFLKNNRHNNHTTTYYLLLKKNDAKTALMKTLQSHRKSQSVVPDASKIIEKKLKQDHNDSVNESDQTSVISSQTPAAAATYLSVNQRGSTGGSSQAQTKQYPRTQ